MVRGFFNFVDVNKIGSHARLWYNRYISSLEVLLIISGREWADERTLN